MIETNWKQAEHNRYPAGVWLNRGPHTINDNLPSLVSIHWMHTIPTRHFGEYIHDLDAHLQEHEGRNIYILSGLWAQPLLQKLNSTKDGKLSKINHGSLTCPSLSRLSREFPEGTLVAQPLTHWSLRSALVHQINSHKIAVLVSKWPLFYLIMVLKPLLVVVMEIGIYQ